MTRRALSIAFQSDKTAAEYVALARLVDRYDFDAVTLYADAPYHPPYAPLMLMAPHLTRARVGVAAASPSRIHPIDIAAQVALLDEIARGGTYIGLARGAWLAEHGISEHLPGVQAIREAADVIRYLLEGRSGGYQGRIYTLAPHVRTPYPLPTRPIPLLIGSWGPRLCALAGAIADEVKVGGSANPDLVPVIQGMIAAGEERAGRARGTVGVVMGAVSLVDEDRARARKAARRAVALYLPVVAALDRTVNVEPEVVERLRAAANAHDWAAAEGLIADDLLDRFALAGNPHDLIEHVARLFEAGAARVEFGTPHGPNPAAGIALLGEKVVPALRALTI